MCSVMAADIILAVLGTNVSNGEVFTAYDITKGSRLLTYENVRSRDVREIVHNEWRTNQMQNFNRELCTLNAPGSPQAFVFFPDGKAAADHRLVTPEVVDEEEDDDMTDCGGNDCGGCDTCDSMVDDSTEDGVVISVEGSGRVNIPRKMLDQIVPTGGSYDFLVNGSLTCRKANANGAIRFSLNTLGFSGDKCRAEVSIGDNHITLSSY